MSNPQAAQPPVSFSEVLEEELKLIRHRREKIFPDTKQPLSGQNEAGKIEAGQAPEHAAIKADEPAALPGEIPPKKNPQDEGSSGESPQDEDARLIAARLHALHEHLTGLAFSGGGIRSGTFAVGLLQGLATLGLLRRVDYLSTVSGGGYAGAWLTAWLKREGDVRNVERQLSSERVREAKARRHYLNPKQKNSGRIVDEEPEPIYHLRSYSSYMAPRMGLLTADTWTIIMIWVRNVSINMLMFLPLAMVVALAARLIVNFYGSLTSEALAANSGLWRISLFPLLLGIVLLVVAFIYNGSALKEFRNRQWLGKRMNVDSGIYYMMVYPILGAALLLTLGVRPVLWRIGDWMHSSISFAQQSRVPSSPLSWESSRDWFVDRFMSDLGLLGLPNIVLHALLFGVVMLLAALVLNLRNGTLWQADKKKLEWRFLYSAIAAGASGGVLFAVVESLLRWLSDAGKPDLAATFGPPAALLALAAALIVEVALLGRSITEAEREWWSRFGALVMIGGLLWIITIGTVFYVPVAFIGAGLPLRVLVTSGWLGTTAAGILTGRYFQPRSKGGKNWLGLIALVAPPVFLAGLFGAVALLAAYLVNDPPLYFPPRGCELEGIENYMRGLRETSCGVIILWLALSAFVAWAGSHHIDVNLFSLNAMYANRLTRCYLGASRRKKHWAKRWSGQHDPRTLSGAPTDSEPPDRDANPATGFDPKDDLGLLDLKIARKTEDSHNVYWGPHLLINTTLNLVGGKELAWRDRKGESFVLSPLYCGSKGTGFAILDTAANENLTLGRAISISGAAVDPNMRFYQSAALTAFLTILNARLGFWMQNPSASDWNAASPKYAHLLFTEFLGETVGTDEFVHLSDGGHFDNLGVYELIRRRCRYIVACDAGEDTGASDDNLAIMIRLCRIDFGVRIQLETQPLRMEGPDRLTRAHVVVGRVRYDDVDSGQVPGILVYIKISLTGDEPSDVQKYAQTAPDFPHQSTDLRQSFDEEQFECYRALGDHIARAVFRNGVHSVSNELKSQWTEPTTHQEFNWGTRRLFAAVQSQWAEPPVDQSGRFLESTKEWRNLQRDLRADSNLTELSHDLYPELHTAAGAPAVPGPRAASAPIRRSELHAVGQMLQIMEDAWIELGLKGNRDLPMNRGWINVFRRWTSTRAFRRLWPMFRSEFSPEFVEFCESQLHLVAADPCPVEFDKVMPQKFRYEAIRLLAQEYRREWPGEQKRGRGLIKLIKQARRFRPQSPWLWLIVQAPSGVRTADKIAGRFVCGIVMVLPVVDEKGAAVPNTFELFTWVRRSHRSIGLGSSCIGPLLNEKACPQLKESFPNVKLFLQVRYPKSGLEGEDDLERIRWLEFFALYDFEPDKPHEFRGQKYSVSTLKIVSLPLS